MPGQATELLRSLTDHPSHQFWSDDLTVDQALAKAMLRGHRQVTDAYLMALAREHGGVVATLDGGLAAIGTEVTQIPV